MHTWATCLLCCTAVLQIRLVYHIVRMEQQAPRWRQLAAHCQAVPLLAEPAGTASEAALPDDLFL